MRRASLYVQPCRLCHLALRVQLSQCKAASRPENNQSSSPTAFPRRALKPENLYGFERLPNLTKNSAQQIADAAKQFGQEDDITVLTLALATS